MELLEAAAKFFIALMGCVYCLLKAFNRLPDKEPCFRHTSVMYASTAACLFLVAVFKAMKIGWLPGGPIQAKQLALVISINMLVALPVFVFLEWRARRALKKGKT